MHLHVAAATYHYLGHAIELFGLLLLREKHGFAAEDVTGISVHLSRESMTVVNDRDRPNVNLQYIFSSALLDGKLSYETAMSSERLKDPAIIELKKRIKLFHEQRLDELQLKRQAIIEVTTRDGAKYSEHVKAVRGNTRQSHDQGGSGSKGP